MFATDSTLPGGDGFVTYDGTEKFRLPFSATESGAMWHAQQKVGISCYAAAVFSHAPGLTNTPFSTSQTAWRRLRNLLAPLFKGYIFF